MGPFSLITILLPDLISHLRAFSHRFARATTGYTPNQRAESLPAHQRPYAPRRTSCLMS
jgi:hypothetical protein